MLFISFYDQEKSYHVAIEERKIEGRTRKKNQNRAFVFFFFYGRIQLCNRVLCKQNRPYEKKNFCNFSVRVGANETCWQRKGLKILKS